MNDKKSDEESTPEEKELATLIDEIAEGGNHDFAGVVEHVSIMLGAAKRLTKIFFNTDDRDTVFEVYDRLDIAANEKEDD